MTVFNVLLVATLAPVWVLSILGNGLTSVCPIFKGCVAKLVIFYTSLAWRVTFGLCRGFIKVNIEGLDELRSNLGSSGRQIVCVCNHTSFLDIMMSVKSSPLNIISGSKMMVSNHIFKMPFLSSIVKAQGHLSVPFKGVPGGDDFTIDKELMAERLQMLEDHSKAGGMVGWFPEGAMNKGDPLKVGTFRAGGFAIPVHIDTEIWCMASVGNTVCWPRSSALGGRPGNVGIKFFQLCESSHDFVSHLPDNEKERSIFLANKAHDAVQGGVDELVAQGYVGVAMGREEQQQLLKEG